MLYVAQAAALEKHLSGYDEAAHVPSRNDAASKLAPVAPPAGAVEDTVWCMSLDVLIFVQNIIVLSGTLSAMKSHFIVSLDAICLTAN